MNKAKQRKHNAFKNSLILFVAVFLGILSHWYFSLKSPNLPEPPLNYLASAHNIDLGVLINPKRLESRIYPGIVTSQYGYVTIDGGGSHFSEIHPAPNKFDFSGTDKMVKFAEKHNMPVQFHHLVWGDDVVLPDWLTKGNYSQSEIREILREHVTTIVKHYKGRIKEYSAVNEAFTENQHIYDLENWWSDHLGGGTEYIDDVFKWAHQADPNAKLLYNDFQNETINQYSDAMYTYLKSAKARGIPIDGVGMQMHVNAVNPSKKQDVIDSMKRFKSIGFPVYITEFDINTNKVNGSGNYKQQLESSITSDMARACIESKSCVSFTAFGVTSKNDIVKWITRTNSRAYMFDSRYRPRSAFYAFRQAWLEP